MQKSIYFIKEILCLALIATLLILFLCMFEFLYYFINTIVIEGLGTRRAFPRKTCFEINEFKVSNLYRSFGTAHMFLKFVLDEKLNLKENNYPIVFYNFVSTIL